MSPARKTQKRKRHAPRKRAAPVENFSDRVAPAPKRKASPVDAYAAQCPEWQQEIISHLRELILFAAPSATESVKQGEPVYSARGPICYIRANPNGVHLGFWRAKEIKFSGAGVRTGSNGRGYVSLTKASDIRPAAFITLIRTAAALNAKHGDPTRKK